jgi:hypothetical protein
MFGGRDDRTSPGLAQEYHPLWITQCFMFLQPVDECGEITLVIQIGLLDDEFWMCRIARSFELHVEREQVWHDVLIIISPDFQPGNIAATIALGGLNQSQPMLVDKRCVATYPTAACKLPQ